MEIGMKKNFAAIALCIAASLCAFADSKSDAFSPTDFVKSYIASGADVNKGFKDGNTMLMAMAGGNAADAVKLLIEAGADIRSEQSKMAEDIC